MFARIFAVLLAVAPNAAVAPAPLQPTSKWNVDYDEAQCVAARDYGTKEEPLFLLLKPSPSGNVMRVLVAKKGGFSGFADQLGGLFCLAALVPATAPAQPTPRQPTGKWVVEYADKMCVLQRDYGTRSAPLMLAFRAVPMGDTVAAYVLDASSRQRGEYVPVTIGFGHGTPTVAAQLATFDIRGSDLRLNETAIELKELERAFETATLSFDARKRLNVSFAVPRLAAAMKALDECTANLMDSWGFSRERQAAMATRPEPLKPAVQYVSGDDYPTEAMINGEMGSNSARYRIDVQGRVSDCAIVETSKSKSLDDTLCRVVKRIRYRPALDKSGKPMESIGFLRLRWSLG